MPDVPLRSGVFRLALLALDDVAGLGLLSLRHQNIPFGALPLGAAFRFGGAFLDLRGARFAIGAGPALTLASGGMPGGRPPGDGAPWSGTSGGAIGGMGARAIISFSSS